jgi:hypothetical protein
VLPSAFRHSTFVIHPKDLVMSIGPLGGIAASFAGTPLAQTKGAEVDRAQQDVSGQQLRAASAQKAEAAAGIGETDGQDHETAERDADGRRPWQFARRPAAEGDSPSAPSPQSKDASGASGSLLDLSG